MRKRFFVAAVCALIAVTAMRAQSIEDSYIAPVNHFVFRLVFSDGMVREFQRDTVREGGLIALEGWDGDISADGRIVIRGRTNGVLDKILTFDRGRLIGYRTSDGEKKFRYEEKRKAPNCPYPPLAIVEREGERSLAEEHSRQEMASKWRGTGRLTFPYINPNFSGALFAQLAILALAFVFVSKRIVVVSSTVLFIVFASCMVMTGSRGSYIGFACALATVVSFKFKALVRSKLFWGVSAILLLTAVTWLLAGGHGNLTRGFTSSGSLGWSNAVRMDMMKAAPLMMNDAPGGWELCHVGKAYLDWYQPLEMFCLTGSLMNDHLSILVKCGWCLRFFYLFTLFLFIGCGLIFAVKKGNPVPLAVTIAFSVMACFNPVFTEWGLWAVPVIALSFSLFAIRWWRPFIFALLSSALLSAIVIYAFSETGATAVRGEGRPPVFVDARRVKINGENPNIWVVDDMRGALGGIVVGKDIRSFYSAIPEAPAMGYVTDIADLPKTGVNRLILAGKAGMDWLEKLSEDPSARQNLPKSVVFVAPPFKPSEIPQGVRALCNPSVVIGEFASLYYEEYGKPQDWIKIIPSMEKYLLLWPQYVIGE